MTREDRPTLEQIEKELVRRDRVSGIFRSFKVIIIVLVVVVAIAAIITTLWLPLLKVSGNSMTPTLEQDDVVAVIKQKQYKCGEMIAFYYNNKILIKRVIAGEGSVIDIDKDGNIYVDDDMLDEPYVKDKALGNCDIELPYQVPEHSWFVLGDDRSVSIDSRSTTIGCIDNENVLGRVFIRIYPFNKIKLF